MSDEYINSNKKLWDELADIHVDTPFYDVASFRKTRNIMRKIERDEVGDVSGKKLLHMQCHFGMDSLSWEQLGASVTGIDFSSRAIHHARELGKELGMNAEFIESDVLKLKDTTLIPSSFDIVYTSHGTIYWLPDLITWAENIAYFLKPGGILYIMDFHPVAHTFDENTSDGVNFKYSYFHEETPLRFEQDGSYAAPHAKLIHKVEYGWQHSIADIINSLINAGLVIEFIHEFPFISWQMLPVMEKRGEWWYFPDGTPKLPLTFSIRAHKSNHSSRVR